MFRISSLECHQISFLKYLIQLRIQKLVVIQLMTNFLWLIANKIFHLKRLCAFLLCPTTLEIIITCYAFWTDDLRNLRSGDIRPSERTGGAPYRSQLLFLDRESGKKAKTCTNHFSKKSPYSMTDMDDSFAFLRTFHQAYVADDPWSKEDIASVINAWNL